MYYQKLKYDQAQYFNVKSRVHFLKLPGTHRTNFYSIALQNTHTHTHENTHI